MINLSQELTDLSRNTNRKKRRLVEVDVPEKVAKYEMGELLGRGTCGVVHRGRDPFVQRNVAIKIAKVNKEATGEEATSTRNQNFFAEAHAAGKLQHPNIVSLFDAGIEGELNYIVMEYVEGETLDRYTKGGERLGVDRVIDIIISCCKALDYSHSQGVVHRDIKPTNVMITPDGDTKIMDFSIAVMNAQVETDQRTPTVGTPGYMSPEQVLGKEIGPPSDLYSLAVVMFEMLTGRRMFQAKTMRDLFLCIIREPAPRLADIRPELPPSLSDVLEKALRKKPEDRFQSGKELAIALGRVFDRMRVDDRKESSRNENRNMLQNLNFFNGFTDGEIDEILDASHLIQYRKDEVIINEGEMDSSFYIIVVGSASVHKRGTLLDTLREGDCFGEIGFLTQTKRTATIMATSDMLVLKVNSLVMGDLSTDTQLHYYKAFTETLIYRLSVTSARLSAAHATKRSASGA